MSDFKLILDLEGYEIRADTRSWVLLIKPRTFQYYSRLEDLFEDLLALKIKSFSNGTDLASLRDAIEKARLEITSIVEGLTTLKPNVSRRLEGVYRPEAQKVEELSE